MSNIVENITDLPINIDDVICSVSKTELRSGIRTHIITVFMKDGEKFVFENGEADNLAILLASKIPNNFTY